MKFLFKGDATVFSFSTIRISINFRSIIFLFPFVFMIEDGRRVYGMYIFLLLCNVSSLSFDSYHH